MKKILKNFQREIKVYQLVLKDERTPQWSKRLLAVAIGYAISPIDLLDLDFDIEDHGGKLDIVAVRLHKDNGNPRYTYDDNDNRIPVTP